jgi:hypothetical protein
MSLNKARNNQRTSLFIFIIKYYDFILVIGLDKVANEDYFHFMDTKLNKLSLIPIFYWKDTSLSTNPDPLLSNLRKQVIVCISGEGEGLDAVMRS